MILIRFISIPHLSPSRLGPADSIMMIKFPAAAAAAPAPGPTGTAGHGHSGLGNLALAAPAPGRA
jgi:hypothetical protein